MSFAKRKAPPTPHEQQPDVDDEAGWAAWREQMRPIWNAKREQENAADPRGYRGTIRTATGELGTMQHGTYYSQGQATEMYEFPPAQEYRFRWGSTWDWAIGVLALNDGSWLCWRSNSLPQPKGWDRNRDRLMPSGGFALHSLRFFTREAALRANAAYVVKRARRQHRWKAPTNAESWQRYNPWPGGDLPADVAQAIISWAMELAARPAPVLYVAPPPPPPPPPEPTDLLMWIDQGRQA